jgi:hypothetical protein
LIIEDALVKLPATAVRFDMIDYRMIVDVLVVRRNVETVERAFGAVPLNATFTSLRMSAPPKEIE